MAFRILGVKVEWTDAKTRPVEADGLVIPANDHLWMLAGPGLELKKEYGKELELEAVRLGPIEPGAVAVTGGGASGYRRLVHAVVCGQDQQFVSGSARAAAEAAIAAAGREKLTDIAFHPFFRGVHGKREEIAREMLDGILCALQTPRGLNRVSVFHQQADEKSLYQEIFLQLLARPQD